MSIEFVIEIYLEMLRTAALVGAPILGAAMIVGLSISLLQTVTSIQEQTLTFVPKILAITLTVGFTLPWILGQLMNFLTLILANAPGLELVR